MNRRTFLKSTALSLIPSTLLLKGENPPKSLQWTSFSSKSPKKEEIILMAEKYKNSVIYNIGSMENELHIGSLFLTDNEKTGKKEYLLLKRLNEQWKLYEYQINKNTCFWITIEDLLKYTKNIPINKSNINMDIVQVKQYKACCEIYAGKIINVNDQEIEIDTTIKHSVNTNKYSNKTWLYQNSMKSKKNDIIQWTELPQL